MMNKPVIGQQISIQIDALSFGHGHGIGRFDGFVLFIPGTAPGDKVLCQVTQIKKRHGFAELLEVQTPSEYRIKPPCPLADDCGGCQWQHVSYEEQTTQKDNILRKALSFIDPKLFQSFIGCSYPLEYRNRIQIHHKNGQFGFLKKGSHDLISVDKCLIARPELNLKIEELRKKQFQFKRAELSLNKDGSVSVSDSKLETHEFSQVNQPMNELLITAVLTDLPDTINLAFDLYCGSGNFSFPLLEKSSNLQVIGVELNSQSVENAKKWNPFGERAKFLTKDVEEFLKNYRGACPDLVFVDPPRAGISAKSIVGLQNLKPKHLFYVSCDPMTLSRDLKKLQDNYVIKSVQGFDMFPQTFHMETLVKLESK